MDADLVTFDRKVVQFLLRFGLFASIVLMVAGIFLNFSSGSREGQGIALQEVINGKLSLGNRLLSLGVLVLVSTPAIRVMALFFLWIREKDWKFVGVSLFVMMTLILSLLLGGG